MISPSQRRKHMDVRLSFRLRQNLQYCSLPCLFLPHPSPLQSFNMFFPLNQALQFLQLCQGSAKLRIHRMPHYLFCARSRQCVRGNIPLHAGHFGMVHGSGTTKCVCGKNTAISRTSHQTEAVLREEEDTAVRRKRTRYNSDRPYHFPPLGLTLFMAAA